MTPTPALADLIRTLRALGIRDERVLAAFEAVPRVEFVPPALRSQAYRDEPLPIPHDQVTTQPSLVASMLEALELSGGERVLEIGTGYGFQAALLARLAGFVWSVERWQDMAELARANLAHEGIRNVEVVVGDGSQGLPQHAPFDAIVVAAAFPRVPEPLAKQVALGGRLIQPMGPGGQEDVTLFVRGPHGLEPSAAVAGARFVRLYGAHGFEQL